MTPDVLAVGPDTPLSEIADLLLHEGVRTIPVVDVDRKVVGVITDGDVLRRADVALPLSIREVLHQHELVPPTPMMDLHARAVMTREVVSVREDRALAAAIDIMAQHGFKRLPVIDEDGRLVGIISRADILQTVAHVTPYAAPQRTPSGNIQRIADVMQTTVPTVRPDAPLASVLEALAGVKQHRVVVVDHEGMSWALSPMAT